jgi:hypothetical protein
MGHLHQDRSDTDAMGAAIPGLAILWAAQKIPMR